MLRRIGVLSFRLPRPELSWSYQQLAAASSKRPPAAEQEPEAQPLSLAVRQLEKVVTDVSLPETMLASNQAALETFKSFIQSLSNPRTYPKAGIKNVQFSVRRGDKVERIRCQLKTTGGECSRLVANTLGEMLFKMGLNPYVYFDGDQFQPNLEKEHTPEEVAAVRAKAAAAGFPSQTITQEQFNELEQKQKAKSEEKAATLDEVDDWSEKLKRMDPLFAAVAAVPWMPTDDDDGARRRHIQTKVLDTLEGEGWDIRGAAHRVWRGERELQRLIFRKDNGSKAAIQSLVFHAKQFDEKYGRKTLEDVQV